jgi:hypothetical protein
MEEPYMRKSRTHFEQIPLEEAKKAANQEGFKEPNAGIDTLILEPASKKSDPHTLKPGSLGKDGN